MKRLLEYTGVIAFAFVLVMALAVTMPLEISVGEMVGVAVAACLFAAGFYGLYAHFT